jgi:hypothetical protein
MANGIWSVSYERWNDEALSCGETDDKGFVCEDVSLSDALAAMGVSFSHGKPITPYLTACNSVPQTICVPEYNKETYDQLTTGEDEQRYLIIPDSIKAETRNRLFALLGL